MRHDRLFPFLIAVMCRVTPAGFSAADAADFYRGKQVTIVVGFTPGGTYPVAGRELQALVDQLSATPKEVIDLVRKIDAR